MIGKKTYLCSSCCFPLVEGSREKGAYLDEIKRKMRGRETITARKGREGGGTGRPGAGVWAGWIWGEY